MFDKRKCLIYNASMKTYLAMGILIELLRNNVVRASVLARKFEVCQRTIYRYLNELESAGIPTMTYTGRNGGIGIDKSFCISSLVFSEQEKEYLYNTLSKSQEQVAHNILNKLS